jgi:hypothetical protein
MYRRIAFAAADLSLAVGGMLLVWGFVRLHEDVQRLYGVLLASPPSWSVACSSPAP